MADFDKLDNFLAGDNGNKQGGKGNLPVPVSPAWYRAEDKTWHGENDLMSLSKKEKANLVQCSLLVQYAPTDRSTCRGCGTKVEKGTLRLGYPFRYRSCEPCYNVYLHPECYSPELFGVKEKELRSRVFGFEALNNTERARLWKDMRSDSRAAKSAREAKEMRKEFNSGSVGVRTEIAPVPVPKQLVKPLLPFQQEGLAWMCHQEKNQDLGGGVLADEMGMGKTIQAISLMLARPLKGPCLVVCPMAAVQQWVNEIERFTTPGAIRTLIYHGAQKANLVSKFRKVDVVITTYQTLENDFRREMNKQRIACKYCGKMFLPEKLAFHQRYFCGPDALRTAKQQKTEKKWQEAAVKGMQTMGIGQTAGSSTDATPTITNIYKDYMKQAGVEVKAKGYWGVMKEARERVQGMSSSSSSASAPASSSKDAGESLSRERLVITDRAELRSMCEKRGLDPSGRKAELIDRLMDFVVQGMALRPSKASSSSTAARKVGRSPAAGAKGKAKAKAKATAKAKAKAKAKGKAKAKAKAKAAGRAPLDPKLAKLKPRLKLSMLKKKTARGSSDYIGVCYHKTTGKWQASWSGIYLGLFKTEKEAAFTVANAMDQAEAGNAMGGAKGKKGKAAAVPAVPRGPSDHARTVGGERAARAMVAGKKPLVAAYSGKASPSQGKGGKRKLAEMEGGEEFQTFEGPQMDLSTSPLHACEWSRIILDEGHRIKGRTNSTAQAAYALPYSGHKWCLTGTPLQNRIGELYSLIRFLRIRPFAYYYCKKAGCKCECARFMRERYCPNCGHVRFMHFSHFKSKVSNPIIKYGYQGAGREAFRTLRDDILNKTMLRRTKEERKADLKLPPIKVVIRRDKLSKDEKDFYSSLYMQSCVQFDTYVKGGTVLHNYAHIFDLLTSLRRATDHPYLIVHGGGANSHKLPSGERLKPQLADICGLCQDAICEDGGEGEEAKRVAKCGHAFHDDCIRAFLADAPKLPSGGTGCPVCFTRLCIDLGNDGKDSDEEAEVEGKGKRGRGSRAAPAPTTPKRGPGSKLTQSMTKKAALAICDTPPKGARSTTSVAPSPGLKMGKKNIMQKVRPNDFKSSTKVEALVDEIQRMIKSDGSAKGLVFSQFGAMLEIVEFRLKMAGISCLVFRGGMTMQARNDALAAFNSDPTLKILLISLKAGGEGLNLQIANHVFMLDPWWNPASEMQAIQRAHRIGQTREVRAVRFITTDTIEEKIIKLQEKKQLVFDACIDACQGSMAKLTEQDLRFLFQH